MWAAGGVSNMAGATPASGQGGPQGSPAGSAAEDTYNAVKPLYLKSRDLPNEDNTYFTVRELCRAAEVVSGVNSMEGAQRIGGLWRLYPATGLVRIKLLTEGISLRGFHVPLLDNNPYIRGVSNREIDTTRLLISDIPLGIPNSEIEKVLTKKGCKMTSSIKFELERDESGHLTHWKTGRRFLYIEVPQTLLPKDIKIGQFTGKLFYKEQRQVISDMTCYNCFGQGHISRECPNPVKCRACRVEGHREGDNVCHLNIHGTENDGHFPGLASSQASASAPNVVAGPSAMQPATPTHQAAGDTLASPAGDTPALHGSQDVVGTQEAEPALPAAMPELEPQPQPESTPVALEDSVEGTQDRAAHAQGSEPQTESSESEMGNPETHQIAEPKEQRKKQKKKRQSNSILQLLKKRPPSPEEHEDKKRRTDNK